jgi:hypothetical protein
MERPKIGFMKNNTQVVQCSSNRNNNQKFELATTEAEAITLSAALQVDIPIAKETKAKGYTILSSTPTV